MARINLLPWRAERRRQRQNEFYGLLGAAAVLGLVLAFGLFWYYGEQIKGQSGRNAYLQEQIDDLDEAITAIQELEATKSQLLARKQVIEQLQANRSQMVHLFDELVRTIPEGVRLSSIKQAGDQLTLEGTAQSNARVSSYMRNLGVSGWMKNPDLNIIEAKGEDKGMPYQFTLRVTLTKPGAKEDEVMFEDESQAGGA